MIFLVCSISTERYTGTTYRARHSTSWAVWYTLRFEPVSIDNCIYVCLLNWWYLYHYSIINCSLHGLPQYFHLSCTVCLHTSSCFLVSLSLHCTLKNLPVLLLLCNLDLKLCYNYYHLGVHFVELCFVGTPSV